MPKLHSDWVTRQGPHYSARVKHLTLIDKLIRAQLAAGALPDSRRFDITVVCQAPARVGFNAD